MRHVLALAALLTVWNNAANLVAAFHRWYVPTNLGLTAVLLLAARAGGFDWPVLGLGTAEAEAGLRWGLAASAVVLVGIGLGLALPRTHRLLADRRLAGMGWGAIAFLALVRIPLGTAVLEEVAFRGVLLGMWGAQRSLAEAVVGSSIVFGLWHIVPTLKMLEANGAGRDQRSRVVLVVAAVVATGLAGVLLSLLRIVSGSVVAPLLAHTAANSLAALAAGVALRTP